MNPGYVNAAVRLQLSYEQLQAAMASDLSQLSGQETDTLAQMLKQLQHSATVYHARLAPPEGDTDVHP